VRVYDAKFSLPMTPGRGRHYTPGEDGIGSLRDVAAVGWSGWRLAMRHSYVFYDGSSSGDEFTRRLLVSRGRYICGAYLDARSPTELHRLVAAVWPRLVETLAGQVSN
jgi:hypothetical protein